MPLNKIGTKRSGTRTSPDPAVTRTRARQSDPGWLGINHKSMKRNLHEILLAAFLLSLPLGPPAHAQSSAVAPLLAKSTTADAVRAGSGAAKMTLTRTGKPDSTDDESATKNTTNPETSDRQIVPPLPLTVEEAIRLALENNNDIRVAETDVRIAEFSLRSARGVYDPVLQTENYFEHSVVPSASAIQGGEDGKLTQNNIANNLQIRGLVPRFGGSYEGTFSSSRQTSNQLFNSLNPQYPTSFSFTFTQPLLRGVRTDDNRRRIEIAKRNVALSDSQFRQRTIETVEGVEAAYWNLTFALKNAQVQDEAVKQAEAQLESNRRQVEQGVLAPIDIVQAETQVANFKQSLLDAQDQVAASENELKRLILPAPSHPYWSRQIIPSSKVALDVRRVSLAEATRTAISSRPEIEQSDANREINRINTRFYRDQTQPRVDLIAGYRADGLAGTKANNGDLGDVLGAFTGLRERVDELSVRAGLPPLPPQENNLNSVPNALIGGFGRSLSNLFSQNYPTVRVGVRVEIPIGNRVAKAELGRSLAEGTKLEYERRRIEQNIEAEVRTALRAVTLAEGRLAAATDARVAAEAQFAGERRQLIAGTSTVFLVLERQTAYVTAQGREIEAQTILNKAIARFARVTGESLERSGVTLR